MDYDALASQFLRALRGRRSQPAFAHWLGYKSNVAYAWEAGRAYPTAAQTLKILERKGYSLRSEYVRFYRREPAWLAQTAPGSRGAAAAFLDDLRGRVPVRKLAEEAGHSRFAVARWLSGESEVRLPEFFSIVQATSFRLLDFVALFVDPARLPSAAPNWRQLEASRRAAYELPWSHAVLRALELAPYRALPRHEPGWIAARLGLPPEVEQESLRVLEESGQILRTQGRYEIVDVPMVDTRRDAEGAWHAREFWTDVARERLAGRKPALYWFNVFGVSAKDLKRIRELQARHFRELRALIAKSGPVEHVVLSVQHLIALDGGDDV
jgi:hypothetical protein